MEIPLPIVLCANHAFCKFERKQDTSYFQMAKILAMASNKNCQRILELQNTVSLSGKYSELKAKHLDVVITVVRVALFFNIVYSCCQTKYFKHSVLSRYSPVFLTPFVISPLLSKFKSFCDVEFLRNHLFFRGVGGKDIYICTTQEERCAFCRHFFPKTDLGVYKYAYKYLENKVEVMMSSYCLLFSIYVCIILQAGLIHSFKQSLTK